MPCTGEQVIFRVRRPMYLINSTIYVEDGEGNVIGEVNTVSVIILAIPNIAYAPSLRILLCSILLCSCNNGYWRCCVSHACLCFLPILQ